MENLTVPKPERGSLMLHMWMHKKVYSKGGSGWHTNMLDHGDVRFWQARGRVALMKNVYLHGEYGFAAHARKAEKEPSDVWTLSLNYDF